MSTWKQLIDTVFRDKEGRIVIWQKPNIPIAVWAMTWILRWPLRGKPEEVVGLIGAGALITWAIMELLAGVNYFRRALGLGVLALCLITYFGR